MTFGITTDYDYNATHKRDRITVWSGPFSSAFEAEGYSLPKGDGYMLTTYDDDKIRVTCPTPRTDANYREVDEAINAAMRAHYDSMRRRLEARRYVVIIRQYREDLAVRYDSEELANWAIDNSLVIDSFCEEDSLDVYVTTSHEWPKGCIVWLPPKEDKP